MSTLWQKTKNGTWYVSYRENGRQKVRSLKTTSRRTALKLREELDALLQEGGDISVTVNHAPPAPVKNPTLDDFWQGFEQWANAHRSASTVEEYLNWFTQLREFTRAEKMGDIRRTDIEGFKASLLKQGKRKPKGVGLDKVSINNALKTLQAIWSLAIKLDLYTGDNPVAGVERFKITKNYAKNFLEKEHIEKLLDAALRYADERYVKRTEARNVYLATALMALAGLRKREVCFARWEWVHWQQRVLCVENHSEFTTKNSRRSL